MPKFDTNGLSTVTITVTDTAYYNNIIAQRERERDSEKESERREEGEEGGGGGRV